MKKNKLILASGILLTVAGALSVLAFLGSSLLLALAYWRGVSYLAWIDGVPTSMLFGASLMTFGIILIVTKPSMYQSRRGFILTTQILAYVFGGTYLIAVDYGLIGLCAISAGILLSVYLSKTKQTATNSADHKVEDEQFDKITRIYELYEKGVIDKSERDLMVNKIRNENANADNVSHQTDVEIANEKRVNQDKDINTQNSQNKEEGE